MNWISSFSLAPFTFERWCDSKLKDPIWLSKWDCRVRALRSFRGCDGVWLSHDKVWSVLQAHRPRPTTCQRPLLVAYAFSGYQAKWVLIGVSLTGKGNAICTLRGFQLRQSLGSTDCSSKHMRNPLLKQLLFLIPSLFPLTDLLQKLSGEKPKRKREVYSLFWQW